MGKAGLTLEVEQAIDNKFSIWRLQQTMFDIKCLGSYAAF